MFNTSCLNETQGQPNVVFVAVYAVVFTAGLTLNIIALVIFFRNLKSRSYTTVYMIHLAFADFLLICTLPVRIYYHAGNNSIPQNICELTGLVMLANMYGSIFLLMCISFDRCIAVCFPLSSCVQEGRKKAWCVCLAIWLLTLGASLPIYLKKKMRLSNTVVQKNCFASFPEYATETVALISTLIIGFGIPLAVMIVSSWGLVRAISRSTAAQNEDLVDSGKIKRMIITNMSIFLLCFLPYHVMLLLLYVYKTPPNAHCSLMPAYRYSLMLACLNAMLDPLAYYFTTETFRTKMDVDAVRKLWQMNSHSSDGNNRSRVPLTT